VLEGIGKWQAKKPLPKFEDKALPVSLYDQDNKQVESQKLGALSLFKNDSWLVNRIDLYCQDMPNMNVINLGEKIKETMLNKYQRSVIT
jgi:hypothetical protein